MKEERRSFARKEKSIPVFFSETKGGEKTLKAETINLASNGLYCKVDKFVELYTKIYCTLVHVSKNVKERISLEGAVVRCEPPEPNPLINTYNIGVFFSDIADEDRKKLEKWLSEA